MGSGNLGQEEQTLKRYHRQKPTLAVTRGSTVTGTATKRPIFSDQGS